MLRVEIVILVAPGVIVAIAVAALGYPVLRDAHRRSGEARQDVDDDLAQDSLPALHHDG